MARKDNQCLIEDLADTTYALSELKEDLDFLRPCPTGAIDPREVESIIGMTTTKDLEDGEELYWEHLKN